MSENSTKPLAISDLIEDPIEEVVSDPKDDVEKWPAVPIDPVVAARYGIPEHFAAGQPDIRRAPALKPYAFRMYCDNYPLKAIARLLNVSPNTVWWWVHRTDWKQRKAELEMQFHNAVISSKVQVLAQISSDAIDIIGKALSGLKKKGDDITLVDARNVSEIFKNMDKVLRLTNGAPTEIQEKRHTDVKVPRTAKEILEVIKADPFMTIDVTPVGDDET